MTFRDKLDQIGASQHALAKRAGIAVGTLHKLITGKTLNPRVDIVYRIHLATKGKITFLDFVDPGDEREVRELIEKFGPLTDAPGPGRPATHKDEGHK